MKSAPSTRSRVKNRLKKTIRAGPTQNWPATLRITPQWPTGAAYADYSSARRARLSNLYQRRRGRCRRERPARARPPRPRGGSRPGCPVERSSTTIFRQHTKNCGAPLRRTAGGGCPRMVRGTASSVLISCPVCLAAQLAVRRGQAVIHSMLYRRQSSQVGEHGFQIAVWKIAELDERHDRVQLSRLHVTGSNSLNKQSLVVVADPARIRCEVGAGRLSPGPYQLEATGKIHSLDDLSTHPWRVALGATSNCHSGIHPTSRDPCDLDRSPAR